MGKVSSQATELVEDYTPSLDTARRVTGERVRSSGVAAVASKVRPQDVGITTLKQNVALVERLRAVAIRSEPPPALPVPPVSAVKLSGMNALTDLDAPDADFEAAEVVAPDADLVERTSALDPIHPIFRSKRRMPSRPEPSVSQIVVAEPRSAEDGEPITNMLPPARRALERQTEQNSQPAPVAAAPKSRLVVAVTAAVVVVAAIAGAAVHHGNLAMASGTTHTAVSR